MKRILALMCTLVLALGLLSGCSASLKTFDTGAGMTISLPSNFEAGDMAGQTAYYESPTVIVTVLKETFEDLNSYGLGLDADSEIADYAQILIDGYELDSGLEEIDGVSCLKYENSDSGTDVSYLATVTKGPDAFWLVQFACEKKNYEKFESDFITWAKSMKFE